MAIASNASKAGGAATRYILITECLQNDFFLNRECRLRLPDQITKWMLLGKKADYLFDPNDGQIRVPPEVLRKGPLGLFLEATIGRRRNGEDGLGTLHVINIRDWHSPGDAYDAERRSYGAHCEGGTWGAAYLHGLEEYLDPAGSISQARFFSEGSIRIYHVHADSVFDFRPRVDSDGSGHRKLRASELEDVLDILIQGSNDDVAALEDLFSREADPAEIHAYARKIDDAEEVRHAEPVYVAAIGVYTDIKIQTLLVGLRSEYNLANLATSDTLTASPTLERHIGGLDFAHKVLGVEVIHGLNNLVTYLGGTASVENEAEIVTGDSYARYKSYFADKQSVLSYQNEKLQDYLLLTERRSLEVYESIKRANRFLIGWGSAFLVLTFVGATLNLISPGRFDWKIPLVTGGLSLLQLVSAFYSKPMQDLQRNLTNLAIFKMILESHSLKSAFTRFHLTTPETLRELQTKGEAEAATRQIDVLARQLGVIEQFDRADFEALEKLGFRVDQATGEEAAAAVRDAPTQATARK